MPPSEKRIEQHLNSGIFVDGSSAVLVSLLIARSDIRARKPRAWRAFVGTRIQRYLAAARFDGHHIAGLPAEIGEVERVLQSHRTGSIASSTVTRRIMLSVCQCSSWSPVISSMGYSVFIRSSAGMMWVGTKGRDRCCVGRCPQTPPTGRGRVFIVGWDVAAFDNGDIVVLDFVGELAADSAVGADATCVTGTTNAASRAGN